MGTCRGYAVIVLLCAWVLWKHLEVIHFPKGDVNITSEWILLTASPSFEHCQEVKKGVWQSSGEAAKEEAKEAAKEEAKEAAKEAGKNPGVVRVVPDEFISTSYKDGTRVLTYFKCIPDTLDPRSR